MRPQSIVRFEQFYLGSAALGVVNLIVNYPVIAGRAAAVGASVAAVLVGAAISWAIIFLFWYFIARRASNTAKWILIVLTALGLLGMARALTLLTTYGPLYIVLTSLVTVLQLVAIVFLFRRDAVAWLRSKGEDGVIDVSTFN